MKMNVSSAKDTRPIVSDGTTEKWGFLRETTEKAEKAGIDAATGLHRTGLNEYLNVIFPNVTDWRHDKSFGKHDGKVYRIRPDYLSEDLKLVVEFDGLPHYKDPKRILSDIINQRTYESFGFKCVRIPYFIQLTREVVQKLFGIDVKEQLFNGQIPSMSVAGKNTPAYLCPAGVKRMAREFRAFPEQYEVNLNALKKENKLELTGVDYLEVEYNALS